MKTINSLVLEALHHQLPWRDRVEVFAMSDHKILMGKNDNGMFLPGGGIEKNDTIKQTAKKECYEELGAVISGVQRIKTPPFLLDYHKLYTSGNLQPSDKIRERMNHIQGVRTIFVKAKLLSIDETATRDITDNMKPVLITKEELFHHWTSLAKSKPELHDYVEHRLNILKGL